MRSSRPAPTLHLILGLTCYILLKVYGALQLEYAQLQTTCTWHTPHVPKHSFAVQSPGGINVSVWFTLFGVASSFISTFFAFSYVKYAASPTACSASIL